MIRRRAEFVILAAIAVSAPAQADVVISSAATQNMSCSAGVCSPTATDAVLNVTDLENMLWEDVTVTTAGSGDVQANNIIISARLAGAWATVLSLDAYESIVVQSKIGLENTGGLSFTTNDGGSGGALWM